MNNKRNYNYLLSDLSKLKGVGIKISNLLKKKKINNIFDLLWKLPKSHTDRSLSSKIKDLRIGENQTITVKIISSDNKCLIVQPEGSQMNIVIKKCLKTVIYIDIILNVR